MAKNVDEARLAVLNEVQEFILGELDEASRSDMQDLFDRFKNEKFQAKTEVPVAAKKGKGKKAGAADAPKKPKKASAHQVFMSEKMKELKDNADIAGKERMTHVNKLWKELDADTKAEYQKRADEQNAVEK
jgi:hypothetical protein